MPRDLPSPATLPEVCPIAHFQRSVQLRDVPGRHDSKGAFQEVWALTLALYRSESSCPPDSAPTAPLIVLRAKVHHCSLQSDRRVPFEEVCPIALWAICAVPEAVQRSGQLPPFL